MEYFLFTYPNCSKCDEMKRRLAQSPLVGKEYSLVQKESKLRIREFLNLIKRDEKGAIIIPTLVLKEKEKVVAILNNHQEFEDWLKSKV